MEAMCKQIHHQLTREFKYALVWGVSAKHSPQRVGLTHQLADEDVVQVRQEKKACSSPPCCCCCLLCCLWPAACLPLLPAWLAVCSSHARLRAFHQAFAGCSIAHSAGAAQWVVVLPGEVGLGRVDAAKIPTARVSLVCT